MSHVHPPPSKVRGWRRPIEIAVLRGRASSWGASRRVIPYSIQYPRTPENLASQVKSHAWNTFRWETLNRAKHSSRSLLRNCMDWQRISPPTVFLLLNPNCTAQKYPQFLFRLDTYIYFVGTRPNRSRFKMGFDLNMPEISIGRVPPNWWYISSAC